jgi:hypothetical protein
MCPPLQPPPPIVASSILPPSGSSFNPALTQLLTSPPSSPLVARCLNQDVPFPIASGGRHWLRPHSRPWPLPDPAIPCRLSSVLAESCRLPNPGCHQAQHLQASHVDEEAQAIEQLLDSRRRRLAGMLPLVHVLHLWIVEQVGYDPA